MKAASAVLALGCALATASTALACGEGNLNMGQGLRYQAYLAPRPATVLVLDGAGSASAIDASKVYKGLQQAGHKLTVVGDPREIERALTAQRFDIVIARMDQVDALHVQADTRLLPVVEAKAAAAPELRQRFPLFLRRGAGLSQYLSVINKAMEVKGT